MIKEIIEYIDIQLALTGYFQKQWGLVELVGIDGKTAPRKYCSKGEWKQVLDFDSKMGHVYLRRNGTIGITENDSQNNISCHKLYDISIPLKLVAVIKRKSLTTDNEFSVDIASDTVMKYVSLQSHTLAATIKAKKINIGLVSKNVIASEILRAEKQAIDRELPYEYIMFSLDLNVVVTSRRECLIEECDDVDVCENLRAYLTQEQKDCILTGYDFSDQTNVDRLTDQQEIDLIAALCTGGSPVVIENSDASYTDTATCGTTFVLPDTTYNVYVDGTLEGTVTVTTLDPAEVININMN